MHEPFEPGGTGHRFLTILATVGVAATLAAVVLRHYPAAWIAALALYGGFEVALGVSQWSGGRSSRTWRRAEKIVVVVSLGLFALAAFTYEP